MRKIILLLHILTLTSSVLFTSTSSAHAEEITLENQTETETSEDNDSQTSERLIIPDQATWKKLDKQEQVQWIVKYVYFENQYGQPIAKEVIEDLIGEADDSINNHDNVTNYVYNFIEEDSYNIELNLAVTNDTSHILEALAVLNSNHSENNIVSLEQFKDAGEVLKDNYKNKTHSKFEDLEDLLGEPQKISFLYDIVIYHYQGEEEESEIALSHTEEQILALNYLNLNQDLLDEPIPADKKDLDLISHTAGVKWQEMTSKFGQPMGINYNSEQGIISLSWYSDAENSVEEVFYYMAYDEIPIGTTYR